jgi:hypothetical protein
MVSDPVTRSHRVDEAQDAGLEDVILAAATHQVKLAESGFVPVVFLLTVVPPGRPALPARWIGVAAVHVLGGPVGPAAQQSRLEASERDETVDPKDQRAYEDHILPPHMDHLDRISPF